MKFLFVLLISLAISVSLSAKEAFDEYRDRLINVVYSVEAEYRPSVTEEEFEVVSATIKSDGEKVRGFIKTLESGGNGLTEIESGYLKALALMFSYEIEMEILGKKNREIRLSQIESILEELVEKEKELVWLSRFYGLLGEVYNQRITNVPGDIQSGLKAKESYKAAYEEDPNNARALTNSAAWYMFAPWIAGGSYRTANWHVKKAIEVLEERDNGVLNDQFLLGRAWGWMATLRFLWKYEAEEVREALDKALEISPRDPFIGLLNGMYEKEKRLDPREMGKIVVR